MLEEYCKVLLIWDVLFDVDVLNQVEGKCWVFKGVQCFKFVYECCLFLFLFDGGDVVMVCEFDLVYKCFVEGGFELFVVKIEVDWIDQDMIYVGIDFGFGLMIDLSYLCIVKVWKCGILLVFVMLVYEGKVIDLVVSVYYDNMLGFECDFVLVVKDFFYSELYQCCDGKLLKIDVFDDVIVVVYCEWLLVEICLFWSIGGNIYLFGVLLVIDFDDFMVGKCDFIVLF